MASVCHTRGLVLGFVSALLVLANSAGAWALSIAPEEYPFEYRDPYIATLSSALAHGAPEALGIKVISGKVEVIPGRDRVPLFEGRGKLFYSFYPQKDKAAPLIFVVAGLGGQGGSGYTAFMAEHLAIRGYQVVTVTSPFNWNFMVAAGTTGLPGLTDEDAEDLYRAMKALERDVRLRHRIKPRSYGAVGFSMGALELAYLSQIDKRESEEGKGIGLDRILLVNPPVDIAHDANLFDHLFVSGLRALSAQQIALLKQKVFNFGYPIYFESAHTPGYFSNLDGRLQLNRTEVEFLIGGTFHDTLTDVIFTSQQINDLGILKEKATHLRRETRYVEARSYLFYQYIGQFVLPQWAVRNQQPFATIEDLKSHSNFGPIADVVAADPRVFLMHNLDDPLLMPEHFDLLSEAFGERAIFYPFGGHVGNVWYSRNVEDLMNVFNAL